MIEIVVADIGGTHARFAIAQLGEDGRIGLGPVATMRTSDHASLLTAWESFAADQGKGIPRTAAIAVACPIDGEILKLTNNPWTVRPKTLAEELGLATLTLVNDFGAVGHAIAHLGNEHLAHLCGPDEPLTEHGVITVVGPGTGLGVAHVLRRGRSATIMESEGGHIDFAPTDGVEDRIATALRDRYRRVSVERLVSGPGLVEIHAALAKIELRDIPQRDDKALWAAALGDEDSLATAALERFCLLLGGFAGDMALAVGASGVVIAGGIGARLAHRLSSSGFAERFKAKGRFELRMARIPVKLVTHPHSGLIGAAASFRTEHGRVAVPSG